EDRRIDEGAGQKLAVLTVGHGVGIEIVGKGYLAYGCNHTVAEGGMLYPGLAEADPVIGGTGHAIQDGEVGQVRIDAVAAGGLHVDDRRGGVAYLEAEDD